MISVYILSDGSALPNNHRLRGMAPGCGNPGMPP